MAITPMEIDLYDTDHWSSSKRYSWQSLSFATVPFPFVALGVRFAIFFGCSHSGWPTLASPPQVEHKYRKLLSVEDIPIFNVQHIILKTKDFEHEFCTIARCSYFDEYWCLDQARDLLLPHQPLFYSFPSWWYTIKPLPEDFNVLLRDKVNS